MNRDDAEAPRPDDVASKHALTRRMATIPPRVQSPGRRSRQTSHAYFGAVRSFALSSAHVGFDPQMPRLASCAAFCAASSLL